MLAEVVRLLSPLHKVILTTQVPGQTYACVCILESEEAHPRRDILLIFVRPHEQIWHVFHSLLITGARAQLA